MIGGSANNYGYSKIHGKNVKECRINEYKYAELHHKMRILHQQDIMDTSKCH